MTLELGLNPEFKILERQNNEFEILESQILDSRFWKFKILEGQREGLGRKTRWRKVRLPVSQALARYVYQQHLIITKDYSFIYEQ